MRPKPSSHSRRIVGRHGSYAETAFKEVIEANRRGTWTLNTQTGHVKTAENQMSGYATYQELARAAKPRYAAFKSGVGFGVLK
ncbi:MAG: hypothetical protein WCC97_02805 [Candidatus Acidiferrales bacterium]